MGLIQGDVSPAGRRVGVAAAAQVYRRALSDVSLRTRPHVCVFGSVYTGGTGTENIKLNNKD